MARSGKQLIRIMSITRHPSHAEVEYMVLGTAFLQPVVNVGWSGFTFFSDVHQCTPVGDSQQHASLQLACFQFCNEPVCGGEGGFLVWWTDNPEELEQGCAHPNNPIPGML